MFWWEVRQTLKEMVRALGENISGCNCLQK